MMIDAISNLAEACGKLQAALKERAMIFMVDEKEFAAQLAGLRIDAYYHLTFAEWEVISSELQADRRALADHFEKLVAFLGFDYDDLSGATENDLRDFWEWYKAEGLAVEISPEERKASNDRWLKHYWTVTVPKLEAERQRMIDEKLKALGSL